MRGALLALLLFGCAPPEGPRIAAAASLGPVLRDLLDGSGATSSLAASSTLARQIERGFPADLFVSADRDWVDWLQTRGFAGTPRAVARNVLVAWVRASGDAPAGRDDLADPRWGRIAVGAASVPVGRYARAALAGLGLDERLLPCLDAPAVLRALRLGEAGVAIGYATDGAGDAALRVAFRFDVDVTYWALPCGPRAEELLRRITGDRARDLWRRHGFLPVD